MTAPLSHRVGPARAALLGGALTLGASLLSGSADTAAWTPPQPRVDAGPFDPQVVALGPSSREAVTHVVSIMDDFFVPVNVNVQVNDTITWMHHGMRLHSVTSSHGLFDSGLIRNGDTFSYTFLAPGNFHYFCSQHGLMDGTVAASGQAGPTATPTPPAATTPTPPAATATRTPTPTSTPSGPATATPLPQPNVGVTLGPPSADQSRPVRFTARNVGCTPNNQLRALRFTRLSNAVVDVPETGTVTAASAVPIPLVGQPASLTLTVRRLVASQPTTVELVVSDGCGDWPTFFGGGPGAF